MGLHIKDLAKSVWSSVNDSLGRYQHKIDKASREGKFWYIPMYHRVINDVSEDPFRLGMCVTAAQFECQLRYIKSNFDIVPLGEAMRKIRSDGKLPNHCASITFDDGYCDNLEIALPIAKKLDITATVFVTTGEHGRRDAFWWDKIIDAFFYTKKNWVDLSEFTGNRDIRYLNRFNIGKVVRNVLEHFWGLRSDTIDQHLTRLYNLLGVFPRSKSNRMQDKGIVSIHRRGWEVGAHTVSHPNLVLQESMDVTREVADSKSYLENLLQTEIEGFAYPGGFTNKETAGVIKNLGFHYAVTTNVGLNIGLSDTYGLERMGMPSTSVADLKRCIAKIV